MPKAIQPFLFEISVMEKITVPETEIRRGGKAVVEKLLKVRRELRETEAAFMPQINLAIEEIRAITRATETQREEIILYAIERQGCTTVTEISEQVRMNKDSVKQILVELGKKGLIYKVNRYVPKSGKPNFSIKSRRVKLPEGD